MRLAQSACRDCGCSALNRTSIPHPSSLGSVIISEERGENSVTPRLWRTTANQCFPGTTWLLHAQAHWWWWHAQDAPTACVGEGLTKLSLPELCLALVAAEGRNGHFSSRAGLLVARLQDSEWLHTPEHTSNTQWALWVNKIKREEYKRSGGNSGRVWEELEQRESGLNLINKQTTNLYLCTEFSSNKQKLSWNYKKESCSKKCLLYNCMI